MCQLEHISLSNNDTQGQATSDVTVDSLRLRCSTISFEVVAESKQILMQKYTVSIKSSFLTVLVCGEGKAGDSGALFKQRLYIMYCLLGN